MSWRCQRDIAGDVPVDADAISRIVNGARGTVIVLADASLAPFERVAPAVSRAMIDAALSAFDAGASPSEAIERARAIVTAAGEDANGWMLFAHLHATIEIAWIGSYEAVHVRTDGTTSRTKPHSLQAVHGPTAPNVATRTLSATPAVADTVTWPHAVGDRVEIVANNARVVAERTG